MPQSATEIRLTNIVACLTSVVTVLNDLHDAFGPPFVAAISSTVLALIVTVQNVKRNREECIRMMEDVHGLVYAIIGLQMKSETTGTLPPAILHDIGRFTETLHKIHVFVEAQQSRTKIQHFFRQTEMNKLLKDCREGLQRALDAFKVEAGLNSFGDIINIRNRTEDMHKDLLELISNLSDESTSDRSSSFTYQTVTDSHSSSKLFSMLPAEPKIFHGRESELQHIVDQFQQEESARIAILGAGGMGKTSLAKVALHHHQTVAKYQHRFFVTAESATTSVELAGLIGSHLGLQSGKNLTKTVIQHFSKTSSCLLILDNLETPWDPAQSRRDVEEFLSQLSDIPHLALIVTMRGAERPGKVKWTRPFLLPLKPLPADATLQTFIDIADDCHNSKDIEKLLLLTDNMPLAVNLIAHLVDYEGCSNILNRWETEKTSLLSEGYNKQSNLDASIAVSLLSPRMTTLPGAKKLLSLLSILPDGLSDVELVQGNLPIKDIMQCKSTLLRTSLAYNDDNRRLRSLGPIREYMRKFYPPALLMVKALYRHFHSLLDIYQKYKGTQLEAVVTELKSNHRNIQEVLLAGFYPGNPDLRDIILCAISFNSFSRLAGHGCIQLLLDQVSFMLPELADYELEAHLAIEILRAQNTYTVANPQMLIDQTINHMESLNDTRFESSFYTALGHYWDSADGPRGLQFLEKALSLAESCGDLSLWAKALVNISEVERMMGDFHLSVTRAQKAQRLAKLAGNLFEEARALRVGGLCCTDLGNYTSAIDMLQRARKALRLWGMSGGHLDSQIANNEAEIHLKKSEYTEAQSIHAEIIEHSSPDQNPYGYAFALLNLAEINIMTSADKHDVQQSLQQAKSIFSSLAYSYGLTCCECTLAHLHLREGKTVAAKTEFKQCLRSSWGRNSVTVSLCLERLADAKSWTECNSTFEWSVLYLVHSKKSQERLAVYKALYFLGQLFSSRGDEITAHSLLVIALDGFTFMDVHHGRGDCLLSLGDIANHRGDVVHAVKLWKEAYPLFERSLQARDVNRINTRLSGVQDLDIMQTQALSQFNADLIAPTPYLSAQPQEPMD